MPRSATTSGATGAMLWNCIAMAVRARKMIAMMNQRCRKTEPVMSGASARQDPRTTTRNGGLGSMSTRRRGAGRSHAGEGVARRLLVLRGEHAHERAPHGFPRAPSEDPLGRGVPARDRAATADGDECVACRAHHLLQGALGLRHLAVEPRVADGHREGVREHLQPRSDGSILCPAQIRYERIGALLAPRETPQSGLLLSPYCFRRELFRGANRRCYDKSQGPSPILDSSL